MERQEAGPLEPLGQFGAAWAAGLKRGWRAFTLLGVARIKRRWSCFPPPCAWWSGT